MVKIRFQKEESPEEEKKEEQFVLEWTQALDWAGNPFQDSVFEPVDETLVNLKDAKEQLNYFFIKKYKFGILRGSPGTGKTHLGKWLAENLRQHKQNFTVGYIYAVKNETQKSFITRITYPLLNILEKKITRPYELLTMQGFLDFWSKKLKSRIFVLIMDDAQSLDGDSVKVLQKVYNTGLPIQILLIGDLDKTQVSSLFGEFKDDLGLTINKVRFDHAIKILKQRIEYFGGQDIYPFNEDELKELFEEAEGDMKKMLRLCTDKAMKLSVEKTQKKKPLRINEAPKIEAPKKTKGESNDVKDQIEEMILDVSGGNEPARVTHSDQEITVEFEEMNTKKKPLKKEKNI